MKTTRYFERWDSPLDNLAYKVWRLLGGTYANAEGNRKDRVAMAYKIAKAVRDK